MNKYKIIWLSENIILIALAIVVFMMKGGAPSRPSTNENQSLAKVQVFKSQPASVSTFFTVSGRVEAANAILMPAEATGIVRKGQVHLKSGQDFKKGDLLFRIDDKQDRWRLEGERSKLLSLLTDLLVEIKLDFENDFDAIERFYKALDVKKKLPQLPTIDNQALKTYLVRKNFLPEYYRISVEEERLQKFKVYAPFNGSITQVQKQIGEHAMVGAPVIRIINRDEMEVRVTVDAMDRNWIQKGQEVNLYARDTKDPYKASVARIGDVINPSTQSIDVFVNVQADQAPILEGMYLTGELKAENIPNSIKVPNESIIGDSIVYLVNDTGLVHQQLIQIHKSYRSNSIISGVASGAQIVISGSDEVNLGDKVEAYIIGS